MFPVGAVIAAAAAASRNRSGAPPPPPPGRLTVAVSHVVAITVLLSLIGGPLCLISNSVKPVVGGSVLTIIVLALVGRSFHRAVTARMGLMRFSLGLGGMEIHSGSDRFANGVIYAAWALLRNWSPARQRWFDTRVARLVRLGDAELVAHGFAAAARGEDQAAYRLLTSVERIAEIHYSAREIAGEYLAVCDAEAGRWAALHRRAALTKLWPTTRLTRFLQSIADQRLASKQHWGITRAWRWLVAPRRIATWHLWHQPIAKLGASQPPSSGADASLAAIASSPVPRLASALARQLAGGDIVAVGAAWDGMMIAPSAATWLTARAIELGVDAGDADAMALAVFAEFDATIIAGMSATLLTGASFEPTRIASDAVHLPAAQRQLRNTRLSEFELAVTTWRARVTARTSLPALDEWRTFLAIADRHDRLVAHGDQSLRRVAFPKLYDASSTALSWFWNERKEYQVSHAIMHRARTEALAVGDSTAADRESRNLQLALPIRPGRRRIPDYEYERGRDVHVEGLQ